LRSYSTALLLLGLTLPACCAPGARSRHSFDEIQQIVAGKTAREVESLLGKPDSRQRLLTDDERWIWWNYTRLDGEQYAPEIRGQLVHLEIVFQGPAGADAALARAEWRVAGPFAVSYSRPAKTD
jgi:hypothetical protein